MKNGVEKVLDTRGIGVVEALLIIQVVGLVAWFVLAGIAVWLLLR